MLVVLAMDSMTSRRFAHWVHEFVSHLSGAVFRPDISATYENYLVVSLCSVRSTIKSRHVKPFS